jgi:hypothetical protein
VRPMPTLCEPWPGKTNAIVVMLCRKRGRSDDR